MKRGRTEIKSSRTARRQAVVCVTRMRVKRAAQAAGLILIILILSGCRESGQAVQICGTQISETPENGGEWTEGGGSENEGRGNGGEAKETKDGNSGTAGLSHPPESEDSGGESAAGIWVHVCGQVRSPGVYELAKGSRVWDAVQAAGGLTQEADGESINLARILEDGSKVTIPSQEASESGEAQSDNQGASTSQAAREREDWYEAPSGTGEASGLQNVQEGKVDINQAGEAELVAIPGIGQTRARAILSYREEHGPFAAIEDIMQVTGIKEGLFAKIRDYITVGG